MLAQKLSIQPCSHVDSRDPDVWWWIKSQCAVNATLLALVIIRLTLLTTILLGFGDGMGTALEQHIVFPQLIQPPQCTDNVL
jgi:hypothetical protein